MSFSFEVKEEICRIDERNPDDLMAELAGMVLFGQVVESDQLKIVTENVLVINRLQRLSSLVENSVFMMDETANAYTATMEGEVLHRFYNALGISEDQKLSHQVPEALIRTGKQFAAFLRGAVLGGGYFSDPASGYHFELVTPYYSLAKSALALLNKHQSGFRMVVRRSNYVIYLKDSQKIYDLLYILGARSSAFELMNIKIEKETNNNNNRIDNCASYNLDKAMNKSVEQIKAIHHIEKTIGLSALADDLAYVATLRKSNPTETLTGLAGLCEGKMSKPSLSRKLNKIVEIANKLKEQV